MHPHLAVEIAMKPVARTFRRQLVATSLILLFSAAFASKSDATCGDYLMVVGSHGQSHASSLDPLDTNESPLIPPSRCKNGQCRSAPPLAPLPNRHQVSIGRDSGWRFIKHSPMPIARMCAIGVFLRTGIYSLTHSWVLIRHLPGVRR